MKYDLSNAYKLQSAREYFEILINRKSHIEIREMKMKRSLDANALYHVWLGCLEKENGINRDEAHLLYRAMFLQKSEDYITNIIRPDLWLKISKMISEFHYFKGLDQIIDVISESTSEQDTQKFSEYLTNIKKHAKTNMGIILLSLDEQNFAEFYKEYGYL